MYVLDNLKYSLILVYRIKLKEKKIFNVDYSMFNLEINMNIWVNIGFII